MGQIVQGCKIERKKKKNGKYKKIKITTTKTWRIIIPVIWWVRTSATSFTSRVMGDGN
jgi:hypothetical protein